MNIRDYAFEEFVERVKEFHGYEAPGVTPLTGYDGFTRI